MWISSVPDVSGNRWREYIVGKLYLSEHGSEYGTLTFNYDIGIRCPIDLVFTSTTTATATNICSGQLVTINFRLM